MPPDSGCWYAPLPAAMEATCVPWPNGSGFAEIGAMNLPFAFQRMPSIEAPVFVL